MRLSLTIMLISISYCLSAQSSWSKEGKKFNSTFQNQVKGRYEGSVNGILAFETNMGDKFISSFSEDSASLNIVPDPNDIYDVSYKYYNAINDNVQIEYGTYAFSNALNITYRGIKYQLNLFDGACIYVIKGLEYEYIPFGKNELLLITFSNKVGLCPSRCYTTPELFIQKGSTLIFTIKNKMKLN